MPITQPSKKIRTWAKRSPEAMIAVTNTKAAKITGNVCMGYVSLSDGMIHSAYSTWMHVCPWALEPHGANTMWLWNEALVDHWKFQMEVIRSTIWTIQTTWFRIEIAAHLYCTDIAIRLRKWNPNEKSKFSKVVSDGLHCHTSYTKYFTCYEKMVMMMMIIIISFLFM